MDILSEFSLLMLFFPRWVLLDDPGGGYLVDPEFAGCFAVEALGDGYDDPFAFGADEFLFNKPEDSTNIFGSFIGGELY